MRSTRSGSGWSTGRWYAATRSVQSICRRKRQTSRVAASSTPTASPTRMVFVQVSGVEPSFTSR